MREELRGVGHRGAAGPASGVITKHGYDSAGREVRLSDGLGRASRTDYNGFGQVSSETDISSGNVDLRTQTYTYDPAGNLTSATNPYQPEFQAQWISRSDFEEVWSRAIAN